MNRSDTTSRAAVKPTRLFGSDLTETEVRFGQALDALCGEVARAGLPPGKIRAALRWRLYALQDEFPEAS